MAAAARISERSAVDLPDCGPPTTVTVSVKGVPTPYTQYEPCGTSNNVVSAYGNGLTTGGANPGFGSTIVTKTNRELQYGLKFTF